MGSHIELQLVAFVLVTNFKYLIKLLTYTWFSYKNKYWRMAFVSLTVDGAYLCPCTGTNRFMKGTDLS